MRIRCNIIPLVLSTICTDLTSLSEASTCCLFFFFICFFFFFFFFFSSRRRHTRSLRDWSSDVCSSDLKSAVAKKRFSGKFGEVLSSYGASYVQAEEIVFLGLGSKKTFKKLCCRKARSEERRVGKECRSRW